ncbi:unnamed protein product [Caenorhabditis auriculariae]|uniref:Uncharacterized protein n=1 Tax=Caenorhabditis auriculariae TaxID=2777116 RepID=A0A8S1HMA4_9PELO|nr:unnamed protein product [Caenorhabditis auriculariae]
MKLLVVLGLLFVLALACDKFDKNVNLFCKFGSETKPCLVSDVSSRKSSCCSKPGGCNSVEFTKEKACCFTQDCLNRCYPGKDYQVGTVY